MCKDKFDEVVELLREEYEAGNLNRKDIYDITEMVLNDILGPLPSFIGTFAEFGGNKNEVK